MANKALQDGFELGPKWTEHINNSMGPKTSPRMRTLMASFTRHIHDFARENELTVDEWMAAVNMINEAGKMSDDRRNEGQLMCDIIGLESLVDVITFQKAADAPDAQTASAILGPFWRHDTPTRAFGESIVKDKHDGEVAFMHGRIIDALTKKPIAGAVVDVWEASTNGLYEQQDKDQLEHNLRGKFVTDQDGRYELYCLKPTPYPIPEDGPTGRLLKLIDRHPMRPAHIHLLVTHDSYAPLTTQIFDSQGPYIDDDAVFAVKSSLIIDFVPLKDPSQRDHDANATLELEYDVSLAPLGEIQKSADKTNGTVINGNSSSI